MESDEKRERLQGSFLFSTLLSREKGSSRRDFQFDAESPFSIMGSSKHINKFWFWVLPHIIVWGSFPVVPIWGLKRETQYLSNNYSKVVNDNITDSRCIPHFITMDSDGENVSQCIMLLKFQVEWDTNLHPFGIGTTRWELYNVLQRIIMRLWKLRRRLDSSFLYFLFPVAFFVVIHFRVWYIC